MITQARQRAYNSGEDGSSSSTEGLLLGVCFGPLERLEGLACLHLKVLRLELSIGCSAVTRKPIWLTKARERAYHTGKDRKC